MIDARARAADVPLDATLAGVGANRRPKTFPAPPIPRGHERASPEPATGVLRSPLLGDIVGRVFPVRERPALGDHPRIDVLAGYSTHCHDAPVAVAITLLACDGPSGKALAERARGSPSATPGLALGPAGLSALRRVDAMEPDLVAGDLEAVPIGHRGRARELCVGRGREGSGQETDAGYDEMYHAFWHSGL